MCFCLGWCNNFVVLNLVKNKVLNSSRIWSTTQLNTPTPTATHCLYMYVYFRKGGGVGKVKGKVEGQQFTRGFENTNMTLLNTSKDDIWGLVSLWFLRS